MYLIVYIWVFEFLPWSPLFPLKEPNVAINKGEITKINANQRQYLFQALF